MITKYVKPQNASGRINREGSNSYKQGLSALLSLGVTCACLTGRSQDAAISPDVLRSATGKYEAVSRDGNSKVWQKVTLETNDVAVVAKTNSYTELATGAAYFSNGQWLDSNPEIQITATGAQALNCQHKVSFLGNINSHGAIDITLPEGDKHLTSTPIGLTFYDTATEKSVMIAEIASSEGQLLKTGNEVLYPSAFTDIAADLLYVNAVSGFEQLVILREQLPSPAEWGLDPETTLLQVITEFINPPVPQITERKVLWGVDQHLDFGLTQMPRGYAFALGSETNTIVVTKQWLNLSGRQCLVESTPFSRIEPLLKELPPPTGQAKLHESPDSVIHKIASGHLLPGRKFAKDKTPEMKLASIRQPKKGVAIDYTTATSQTNFTFQGDTTYYISSNVTFSGTTTFEGGSVIKFTNNSSAKISLTSFLSKGSPYRMVILTSKDDNTVGDAITGSTGSPTNLNGATFLSGAAGNYSYLRFSYAGKAISGYIEKVNGGEVWHCQFYRCATALLSQGGGGNLHNVLFSNCGTAVDVAYLAFDDMLRGEHITADKISIFYDPGTGYGGTLTNSILTSVTNIGADMTLRTCTTNSSSAGFYQTIGAASYYLAESSTNRNAGLTNITSSLANAFKSLTTYPPILLTNAISSDTLLTPQAQRDTDIPDIGYHYVPLDYVANGRVITNTLFLTNGVALGTYGASASYGVSISGSGKIVSQGIPNSLNYIVRYNTVQEQTTTNWSATTVGASVVLASATASAQCRFTGWSTPGGNGDHVNSNVSGNVHSFKDCQFTGGKFTFDPGSVGLTNCLFERVSITLRDSDEYDLFYLYNNLFKGGTISYKIVGTGFGLAYDNLFDVTTISKGGGSDSYTCSNNGYVTNKNKLTASGTDVILTNTPVYLTSYLGNYYYPTNDGMLSTLTNAGSRYATNATLYHYTCFTNQQKEASSMVEIGFHYVATDSNGIPLDSDADGISDYMEDSNGNGTPDIGETEWTTYNSQNGLAGATGLQVFTPLK
jgi:hypothetical protein